MTSRGGVEGGRRRGFFACGARRRYLKHGRAADLPRTTQLSRAASSTPDSALLSPRGRRLCHRGRYRFQTVAPATVFVRRLNQPRCVTQPSAEQRIRPAPRISHAYQNKRRRPTDARRAALDQAPTKKKTGVARRPCLWHG